MINPYRFVKAIKIVLKKPDPIDGFKGDRPVYGIDSIIL